MLEYLTKIKQDYINIKKEAYDEGYNDGYESGSKLVDLIGEVTQKQLSNELKMKEFDEIIDRTMVKING